MSIFAQRVSCLTKSIRTVLLCFVAAIYRPRQSTLIQRSPVLKQTDFEHQGNAHISSFKENFFRE